MPYERKETHEDWIRLSDAMYRRLGISEDPSIKASRMNSIVAFTPLFSIREAREQPEQGAPEEKEKS